MHLYRYPNYGISDFLTRTAVKRIEFGTDRFISGRRAMSKSIEYEYYNAEQKQRYIDTSVTDKGVEKGPLQRLFTRTRPYEEQNNKDCSMFTVDEIRGMYSGFAFSSREALLNDNSRLNIYTDWCMEQASDEGRVNPYAGMRGNIEEFVDKAALSRKLITRVDLLQAMTILENDCDRFMLLAMFEGILGPDKQELLNLRLSDFHYKAGTWYADLFYETRNEEAGEPEEVRRTVVVSEKLKELADLAAHQEVYKTPGSDRTTVFSDKQFSDSVIKLVLIYTTITAKNARSRSKVIHKRFFNLMSVLKVSIDDERAARLCELTPVSLTHSGILHMMSVLADRENISMRDVLYTPELVDQIDRQYDCNLKATKAVFCRKYAMFIN